MLSPETVKYCVYVQLAKQTPNTRPSGANHVWDDISASNMTAATIYVNHSRLLRRSGICLSGDWELHLK